MSKLAEDPTILGSKPGSNPEKKPVRQQNPKKTQRTPQDPKQKPQKKQQQTGKKAQTQAAAPPPSKSDQPESSITQLFSHLMVVKKLSSQELLSKVRPADVDLIHPSLIQYALQTAQEVSIDENEKCRRLFKMLRDQIIDEPLCETGRLSTSLMNIIKRSLHLLNQIRMTTPGISNATRYIKEHIRNLAEISDLERYRSLVVESIDQFIKDKVDDVAEHLARTVADTIVDGDVILTYGWSPAICDGLKQAHKHGKQFRVIVVDSRPNFDARTLVEQIQEIDVRYVLISGLSYVMPEATKVLIEPCGILSNNAALTTIGTAMISMVSHECGVPVIFVCPSYRFVVDVRIDALAKNEILSNDFIEQVGKGTKDNIEYLCLMYDVTPGQFVDVVISELGNLPVNSISTNIKFIQKSYTLYSKTLNEVKQ